MTATEQLRKLLDERGVEWRKTPHYSSDSVDNETVFCGEGIEWLAHDHLNGRLGLKTLRYEITPAQAIAATLGDSDATRARQLDAIDEILRTLNAEVTNDNIKYGLYSELHDMVGELANLIEMGAEPIDAARGAETCTLINAADDLGSGTSSCMCFECGYTALDDWWEEFNFCPNCGRRIEVTE